MRRFFLISIISYILFSCDLRVDKTNFFLNKNIEKSQLSPFSQQEPKYFGFWGSAMNGVGNGNYIDQTKDFSNVAFVRADAISEWKSKISQAKNVGQLSILMIQNLLFPWASSHLYSDAFSRFKSFWDSLEPSLQEAVLGFYIFDEPYWNNSMNTWDSVSENELHKNLEESIKIINQITKGKLTMLTFAHTEVSQQLLIPENADWIGVNCYASFGNVCSEAAVMGYLNILKQKKTSSQKFMLTIDSYWNTAPSDESQAIILKRIDFWQKWIDKQTDVIAITPFIWQNHIQEQIYGAESMPNVRAKLIEMGKSIVKLSNNIIRETCILLAPACEGLDYVRRDSCGNEIERLVNASNCAVRTCTLLAPACEGLDYVRRDSCGNEIERLVNASNCVVRTCTLLAPACEGMDYVRRNSCGIEIDRWVNASYCSTVSCEGSDYVRRDSTGKEVERWINAPDCTRTQCTSLVPVCEGMDYVRRNSCGIEIDRWVNAPYCSTVSCEGSDYVRRDSTGKEVERWINAPIC